MELLRRKSFPISLNCQTDRAHKEAGVEECTWSHQCYNFLPERWQHCQAEQWQPELWSLWPVSLLLHSNIHWSRLNRSTLNSTFFWAGPSTSIRISQGNLDSGYRCEINIHANICLYFIFYLSCSYTNIHYTVVSFHQPSQLSGQSAVHCSVHNRYVYVWRGPDTIPPLACAIWPVYIRRGSVVTHPVLIYIPGKIVFKS